MPDDQFHSNSLSLRMALGGQGADLLFEIFDFGGPVTREFVSEVAGAMMRWTLEGFFGTFNTRLSRGKEVVWVVLRFRDGAGS